MSLQKFSPLNKFHRLQFYDLQVSTIIGKRPRHQPGKNNVQEGRGCRNGCYNRSWVMLRSPRIFGPVTTLSLTLQNLHLTKSSPSGRTMNKMSTYTAQGPSSAGGTPVPDDVIKFYENFYRISDDPSDAAHEAYVDSFTKEATLIMGSKSATGSTSLMEMRRGLWSGPVQTRLHTVKKIFPWDKSGNEIMLYGDVLYGLKNGKSITVEWGGRALLERANGDPGQIRMKFYQVYLVCLNLSRECLGLSVLFLLICSKFTRILQQSPMP